MNINKTMSSAGLLLMVSLITACSAGDAPPATTTTPASTANPTIVANAGPDQSALVNALIALNGVKSFSTQNTILTYSWTLRTPAGSSAKLSNPTAVDPTLTVDLAGTYEATLIVKDGKQTSPPDTVIVAVGTINAPPAAVITSNSSQVLHVTYNQPVTLDGKDSNDQNHDLLNFKWTVVKPDGSVLPNDQLALSNTAFPVFTPDVQGLYTVGLVVNDGTVDSTPVQITVSAEDKPGPTADAGPSERIIQLTLGVKTLVALSGSGSTQLLNGDGSLTTTSAGLTYQWVITPLSTQTPPLASSPPYEEGTDLDKADASFKVPINESGRYKAELTVTEPTHPDLAKKSAIDSILIKVAPKAYAGTDQTAKAGATVTLDGSGSLPKNTDPADFLSLAYQWSICPRLCLSPTVIAFSSTPTATFRTSTLPDETYTATLTVRDSLGHLSDPDQMQIFTKTGPIITGITMTPAFISPSNQTSTSVTVSDSSTPRWSFPTGTFVNRNSPVVTATASLEGIIGNPTCLWKSFDSAVAITTTPPSCTSTTFTTSVAGTFTLRLTVTDTLPDGFSLETQKDFNIRVATPPGISLSIDPSNPSPKVCTKTTIKATVTDGSGTIDATKTKWGVDQPTKKRNTTSYVSKLATELLPVKSTTGDVSFANPFRFLEDNHSFSTSFWPDLPADFIVTLSVSDTEQIATKETITVSGKALSNTEATDLLGKHGTFDSNTNTGTSCAQCHTLAMWNKAGGTAGPDHSAKGLQLFFKFNADGTQKNHSSTMSLPAGVTRENLCALFQDFVEDVP